ncbi:MAG: phosphoribosylanthranilate isomerase [Armatimonadetes bacterium]|nr:phosphoribosylanthranilate isomerase [Armatimonadota bacterium]
MTRVKICGVRSVTVARAAVAAGADAIGFIFYPPARRFIEPEVAVTIARALPPFVACVGVFVDRPREEIEDIAALVGLDALQLHGQESPADCLGFSRPVIRGLRVRDKATIVAARSFDVAALLLDTHVDGVPGGSGKTFDWSLVRGLHRPVILSGGLHAENVPDAIAAVKPYAVDVSSGVETNGEKDPAKIRAFVEAVRRADAEEIKESGVR